MSLSGPGGGGTGIHSCCKPLLASCAGRLQCMRQFSCTHVWQYLLRDGGGMAGVRRAALPLLVCEDRLPTGCSQQQTHKKLECSSTAWPDGCAAGVRICSLSCVRADLAIVPSNRPSGLGSLSVLPWPGGWVPAPPGQHAASGRRFAQQAVVGTHSLLGTQCS